MDTALAHQAEVAFGEATARTLQNASAVTPRPEASLDASAPCDPSDPSDQDASSSPAVVDIIPPVVKLNLTPRQERRLWRHIASVEDFWETLEETEPGVIMRLAEIAAARRWEIIFLTKRPKTMGGTAQVQSQRWLASKGFPLPSVYVVQGSRGRIASALDLDVVVDDRPENCLDVVIDSKARAILVWREDEKALPTAARRRLPRHPDDARQTGCATGPGNSSSRLQDARIEGNRGRLARLWTHLRQIPQPRQITRLEVVSPA